ncbi:MAG: hypothetical protein KAS32_20255 [Candidatus Peribacteraceae bacterium]|nr:hypothetical protein [Candidatus Peribacteraceae bacterium]
MPTNKALITFADKTVATYGQDLSRVMRSLEKLLIDLMADTRVEAGYNIQAIQNSFPAMRQALAQSGYDDLAAEFVGTFEDVPGLVSKTYAANDLPSPKYVAADAQVFTGLAQVDLDNFAAIGEKALEDLRLGLYRQAVASEPFSNLVETIRAATVGVDGKGSAMANHAYTHANTAMLNFQGETLRIAGESLGFDSDDSLWEVVGPDDEVTRDVCEAALAEPVRTKAEWIAAGYWGGTPGGWNCRHQLFPYFGEKP